MRRGYRGNISPGISWIGLPTSLLAQVDSSVGGKTGINHALGKNLIGLFHQPFLSAVKLISQDLVPQGDHLGAGEVIKYGFVLTLIFSSSSQGTGEAAESRGGFRLFCVSRSLKWKAHVVGKDERDQTGLREVLNFGHTFGHVLESVTQYKGFQHARP